MASTGKKTVGSASVDLNKLRDQVEALSGQVAELQTRLDLKDAGATEMPPQDAHGNYPAAAAAITILAQKVREMRIAAGLKQEELALRAGVRVETISRLESGKHSPNVATVAKVERALQEA